MLHIIICELLKLAPPEGFEPPTPGVEIRCSDPDELRRHFKLELRNKTYVGVNSIVYPLKVVTIPITYNKYCSLIQVINILYSV